MAISSWFMANGEDMQALLFLIPMAVLIIAERFAGFRQTDGNGPRWRTNAVLTVLSLLSMGIVPISFLGTAVWAESTGFGLLNLATLPVWLLVTGTLLLRGGVSTFTHWLNHRSPWLWRLHRVHHLDTEMDVTTTVRLHPLEMPVSALIGIPLVAILGLSPWVLLVYELLDASITVITHSNLQLPKSIDRWLCYVFVTPSVHRVHHSSYQPETDSNFGAVFPIWDIIFGTFRKATINPQQTMQIGLAELRGREAQRILALLLSPLRADVTRFAKPIGMPGESSRVEEVSR